MEQSIQLSTNSNFGFSGTNVDSLTGSKYTLVCALVDVSGSVSPFSDSLENAANIIVQTTKKSPEAENIMMRLAVFHSSSIDEINGFTPVVNLPDDKYTGKFVTGGSTPLVDASVDAAESIETYGKTLVDQEYLVNGIFFVITDGEENTSRFGNNPVKIKEAIDRIRRTEAVESIVAILVGVNDTSCKQYLNDFKDKAGFDHYVSIGDATPGKLAKLGQLISKSVSSQSQAIGSGGPSKTINNFSF